MQSICIVPFHFVPVDPRKFRFIAPLTLSLSQLPSISLASQDQTTGIDQINQAMGQMDQVTQSNAALVEEAAAAAQSLEHQAQTLVQVVSVFKTGASGQRALAG